MTVPEPAAYQALERRLDEVLGVHDAATLRIMLSSLATKDDLDLVRLELADFKKDVGHEFALMRTEVGSLRHELIGVFRGEVNAAITSQTKPLLVGFVSVAVVVAGAVLGAFQLA